MKNYFLRLLRLLAASALIPNRLRAGMFRLAGMGVGEHCLLMSGLSVPRDGQVRLGNDVYINYFCYLDASDNIDIGDHVHLADHVRLLTSSHEIGREGRRAGPVVRKPLRLEAGCWLGSGVTILPGVTVGRGCIIAAGAVVTGDCMPNGLYAGVPARRIKDLPI